MIAQSLRGLELHEPASVAKNVHLGSFVDASLDLVWRRDGQNLKTRQVESETSKVIRKGVAHCGRELIRLPGKVEHRCLDRTEEVVELIDNDATQKVLDQAGGVGTASADHLLHDELRIGYAH